MINEPIICIRLDLIKTCKASFFSKKAAELLKIVEKSEKIVQKITFLMKNC